MTDPRNDPHLSEIVTRLHDRSSAILGWIAGGGIVVLIAIILAAGWSNGSNIESVAPMPPAATADSAPMRSLSTFGAAPKTHLLAPAKPAALATPKPGTQ